MASIEYNSGAYSNGVDFTPSTTVHKKILLKDMNVNGVVEIPETTVTDNVLTLQGLPAYTFTGTETFNHIDIVINPLPGSKEVVVNATEAYLTFQMFAQGTMTLSGVDRYVEGAYQVKVNLQLTAEQRQNLTLDTDFVPFVKSYTNGAVKLINGVYQPTVDITFQKFTIGAVGNADIEVVLATP